MKTKAKKKKKQTQKKLQADKVLLVIFLLLCVVVFILAIVLVTKKNDYKKDRFDINIPLTKEELAKEINMSVETDSLKKSESKEYKFRVVNYLNNDINKEELTYKISLKAKDSLKLELYSTEENKELLRNKKQIANLKLPKNKKKTITYTLKITKTTSKDAGNVNIIISKSN